MTSGSSKLLPFTKMHATGSDAIVLNCLKKIPQNPQHLARKLCHRNTGIGGNQLLLLLKSKNCDFGVKVYNADGSEAQVCGNALRCIARYVREEKLTPKKELLLETGAGPRQVKISSKLIEVDMDEPRMKGKEIPVNLSGRIVNRPLKIDTKDFRITCLSLGTPHCVVFQEAIDTFPVTRFGPLFENHSVFPQRVNISFVNVIGKKEIHTRVWERGVGETAGCSSAASAALVASVLNGFADRSVTVHMPGGKIEVDWNAKDNHIILRGPAEKIFTGEFLLP